MSNAVYPSQIHGFTYTVLRTPEFATLVQQAPDGSQVRIPQMQNPTWHITLIYDYLYGQYNSPNNTMPYAPYSDIDTLVGFYLARQGQSDDFLWIDPKNNAVGPAVIGSDASPNLQAELALVDDGLGHYYSPVQRLVGGLYYEDITDLNGNIQVYANGVLKSGYTIVGPGYAIPGYSWRGLVLQWTDTAAGWASTHAYTTTGWQILDTNGHIQQVTTAGTSGASMPVWNSSGGTTTDGTVTWTDQGYYAGPTRPITAQFNYYFRMRFETDTQDFEQFMDELYTIGGSESKNGSGMLKLMTSRTFIPAVTPAVTPDMFNTVGISPWEYFTASGASGTFSLSFDPYTGPDSTFYLTQLFLSLTAAPTDADAQDGNFSDPFVEPTSTVNVQITAGSYTFNVPFQLTGTQSSPQTSAAAQYTQTAIALVLPDSYRIQFGTSIAWSITSMSITYGSGYDSSTLRFALLLQPYFETKPSSQTVWGSGGSNCGYWYSDAAQTFSQVTVSYIQQASTGSTIDATTGDEIPAPIVTGGTIPSYWVRFTVPNDPSAYIVALSGSTVSVTTALNQACSVTANSPMLSWRANDSSDFSTGGTIDVPVLFTFA
jgi:hypothetical protein